MEYAIVDIETTGASAANSGITEIAIYIYDGEKVTGKYETLINPQRKIPRYIEVLTGISNEMVDDAPSFSDVAENIFSLLNGKIFIAHNVNFDYSFIRHHLEMCGYHWHAIRLCTVRMSRKIFPGLYSYNLEKLCHYLSIPVSNRHRAGGDAAATTILFELLLKNDDREVIKSMLKKGSGEQLLPPNVNKKDFEKLPSYPGIYYFKNRYRKIIYVGKAKNIKRRVTSHFIGNRIDKQRQDFLKEIFFIDYQSCSSEKMAMILEVLEIKKYWPKYNYAAKHYDPKFGLFFYEDSRGFFRLAIGKFNKSSLPVIVFFNREKACNKMRELIEEFNLCKELCFMGKCDNCCSENCSRRDINTYNMHVKEAIDSLKTNFAYNKIIENNTQSDVKTCLLLHDNNLWIGNIHENILNNEETIKNQLPCYPLNEYVMNMLEKMS